MKGAEAEDRAAAHLQSLGREVLARNYRIPGGEIDLVTREQGGTLVFTEVRQRRGARYGTAAESVTGRKLALMQRAALAYLTRELGRDDLPCRLEVLTIDGLPETGPLALWPVEIQRWRQNLAQMRSAYLTAARALQRGREHAVEGDQTQALNAYGSALGLLRTLPPERTRDVLLAHTHLAFYQTLALVGDRGGQHHLHQGVSYARATRDPLARAIAEECLSGLDVVM